MFQSEFAWLGLSDAEAAAIEPALAKVLQWYKPIPGMDQRTQDHALFIAVIRDIAVARFISKQMPPQMNVSPADLAAAMDGIDREQMMRDAMQMAASMMGFGNAEATAPPAPIIDLPSHMARDTAEAHGSNLD